MPPKLIDIARRAGVSVTTASNALNDYTKSRIKRETVDHVKAIALDMGYRPNEIARSLKRQRTNTIAFYNGYGLTDFRDRFYGETLTGVEKACANNGVDLLLFCTINRQSVADIVRELTCGKVDGVLIHASPDNTIADLLAESSMPCVSIADKHSLLPSVTPDNDSGLNQVIDLLWSHGHRDIAFVAPLADFESVTKRMEAYNFAMARKGCEPRVIRFDWSDAYDHIVAQISAGGIPTALCCWNDACAYHILSVFRTAGIRVPEDVSITGFDGFLDGQFPYRRITTVHIPWADIASAAVNKLVKMRCGEKVLEHVVYSTTLQNGDTVADACR